MKKKVVLAILVVLALGLAICLLLSTEGGGIEVTYSGDGNMVNGIYIINMYPGEEKICGVSLANNSNVVQKVTAIVTADDSIMVKFNKSHNTVILQKGDSSYLDIAVYLPKDIAPGVYSAKIEINKERG